MMQRQAVPRSLALDYAVGLCGIWISSGFFLDAWAHGHVPVESFFTPYHAAFYSGMLAMLLVLELAETTMEVGHRRLEQIMVEDAVEAEQIFTDLMGDKVEPRKQYIFDYAKSVKTLDL